MSTNNTLNQDDDLKNILEFLKRPENAHLIDQPTEVVQHAIREAGVTSYGLQEGRGPIRSPYSYVMRNPAGRGLLSPHPDAFIKTKSERMIRLAYYLQAEVSGSVGGVSLDKFMTTKSFDEITDKEVAEETDFGYSSMFPVIQALDLFQRYTTRGSSPLERFRVFATIAGFAGEVNCPVSIFEMDMLLNLKQNTFSRHLWSLQSSKELTDQYIEDRLTGMDPELAAERLAEKVPEPYRKQYTENHAIIKTGIEPQQFGLIEATPPAPDQDGRRKYYKLTEKGLKLAKAIKEIFHNAELPKNEGSDDTQ
jgi:hypothetical protein